METDAAQTLKPPPPQSRPTGPGPEPSRANGQRKDGAGCPAPWLRAPPAEGGLPGKAQLSHELPRRATGQTQAETATRGGVRGQEVRHFRAGRLPQHPPSPKQHAEPGRPGGSHLPALSSSAIKIPVPQKPVQPQGSKDPPSPLRGRRSQQACPERLEWVPQKGPMDKHPREEAAGSLGSKAPVASGECVLRREVRHTGNPPTGLWARGRAVHSSAGSPPRGPLCPCPRGEGPRGTAGAGEGLGPGTQGHHGSASSAGSRAVARLPAGPDRPTAARGGRGRPNASPGSRARRAHTARDTRPAAALRQHGVHPGLS